MPIPSQIAPHNTDRVGKRASKNAGTHKLEKGFDVRRVDRRMRRIDFGPFCRTQPILHRLLANWRQARILFEEKIVHAS